MPPKRSNEPAGDAEPTPKRSQRAPKPSQRLIESQQPLPIEVPRAEPLTEVPIETEPPIEVPTSTIAVEERVRRPSPLPILQASQASQPVNEPAWESELVATKPTTATQLPLAFSSAATEASDVDDGPVDFTNYEALT